MACVRRILRNPYSCLLDDDRSTNIIEVRFFSLGECTLEAFPGQLEYCMPVIIQERSSQALN